MLWQTRRLNLSEVAARGPVIHYAKHKRWSERKTECGNMNKGDIVWNVGCRSLCVVGACEFLGEKNGFNSKS